MAFANYEFYTKEYHGKLAQDEYEAAAVKANAEIVAQIFGRTSVDMTNQLKLCECELTDALSSFAVGVTSVSNDGYSVQYAQNQNQILTTICKRYLTTPINLMRRWV